MMEILKYRKDANSPWKDIIAIVGPKGKDGKNGIDGKDGIDGKNGIDGKDYILTEDDKIEIVNLVLDSLPSGEGVAY